MKQVLNSPGRTIQFVSLALASTVTAFTMVNFYTSESRFSKVPPAVEVPVHVPKKTDAGHGAATTKAAVAPAEPAARLHIPSALSDLTNALNAGNSGRATKLVEILVPAVLEENAIPQMRTLIDIAKRHNFSPPILEQVKKRVRDADLRIAEDNQDYLTMATLYLEGKNISNALDYATRAANKAVEGNNATLLHQVVAFYKSVAQEQPAYREVVKNDLGSWEEKLVALDPTYQRTIAVDAGTRSEDAYLASDPTSRAPADAGVVFAQTERRQNPPALPSEDPGTPKVQAVQAVAPTSGTGSRPKSTPSSVRRLMVPEARTVTKDEFKNRIAQDAVLRVLRRYADQFPAASSMKFTVNVSESGRVESVNLALNPPDLRLNGKLREIEDALYQSLLPFTIELPQKKPHVFSFVTSSSN